MYGLDGGNVTLLATFLVWMAGYVGKYPCFQTIHTEILTDDGAIYLQLILKWFRKKYRIKEGE